MKFHFVRKYTTSFIIFLILVAISIAFYFVGPNFINRDNKFFLNVLLISLLDSIIITIFIMGLYRVNYYLFHDHIEIHRSLRRTIHLHYNQIEEIQESPNDTIFLIFGKRPSFRVKYRTANKLKNYRIRVENHELLKLVLQNEKKIHIATNK